MRGCWGRGFNRNIVECKLSQIRFKSINTPFVLIETLWNVNDPLLRLPASV